MRIIAALGAGLLAIGGVAALPADAHPRYGWNDRGPDWRDGRGWRGGYDRGWRGDQGRGWRGDRGDRGGRWGYRGRYRTVCDVRPGRFGPVRECFRVRR